MPMCAHYREDLRAFCDGPLWHDKVHPFYYQQWFDPRVLRQDVPRRQQDAMMTLQSQWL
jgi:hypothetical protein